MFSLFSISPGEATTSGSVGRLPERELDLVALARYNVYKFAVVNCFCGTPTLGTFGIPPCILFVAVFLPKATWPFSCVSYFFSSSVSFNYYYLNPAEAGLLVPAVEGRP